MRLLLCLKNSGRGILIHDNDLFATVLWDTFKCTDSSFLCNSAADSLNISKHDSFTYALSNIQLSLFILEVVKYFAKNIFCSNPGSLKMTFSYAKNQ